jgi:hypothetical protein
MLLLLQSLLASASVPEPQPETAPAATRGPDDDYSPRLIDHTAQNEQIIFDMISSLLACGVLED